MTDIPLASVLGWLERLAPLALAESWDNVGLLVGDRQSVARRVMTCLTITPAVVAEAVEQRVDLVIAHHPLPFQPLKRITADTTTGRMLLDLIAGGVAVYSAHTAYDSAERGINQQIAERLELAEIAPLQPAQLSAAANEAAPNPQSPLGSGRYGRLERPETLQEFGVRVRACLGGTLRTVGDPGGVVRRVAIGCGSGGSFLDLARRRGCDALVTGEANFHSCLEGEATGVAIVLVGHYASERFAVEVLAQELAGAFPALEEVWASRREQDPIVTWPAP